MLFNIGPHLQVFVSGDKNMALMSILSTCYNCFDSSVGDIQRNILDSNSFFLHLSTVCIRNVTTKKAVKFELTEREYFVINNYFFTKSGKN